jgi:hypothetical protein
MRVFIYQLVLTSGTALLSFDRQVVKDSLPLAAAGWCVAPCLTLLYSGLVPKDIQPCS